MAIIELTFYGHGVGAAGKAASTTRAGRCTLWRGPHLTSGIGRVVNEDADGWWKTRRVLQDPLPVWVYLPWAFPRRGVGVGRDVPMRVRVAGLDTSVTVPGEVLVWHQTFTGEWWALTRFEVTNRAGRAHVALTQLVSERAVRKR